MLACGFLDGATLVRYGLFLGLALAPRARIDRPRQMRNLCPLRADLSFLRFRVRIHSTTCDRRRRSQLFTRTGHWNHKLPCLLGDEISGRARRHAFGVFLLDGDH